MNVLLISKVREINTMEKYFHNRYYKQIEWTNDRGENVCHLDDKELNSLIHITLSKLRKGKNKHQNRKKKKKENV